MPNAWLSLSVSVCVCVGVELSHTCALTTWALKLLLILPPAELLFLMYLCSDPTRDSCWHDPEKASVEGLGMGMPPTPASSSTTLQYLEINLHSLKSHHTDLLPLAVFRLLTKRLLEVLILKSFGLRKHWSCFQGHNSVNLDSERTTVIDYSVSWVDQWIPCLGLHNWR